MNLGKKLSLKQFILSLTLIFITGLGFIAGLYYLLNLEYQKQQDPFSKGPVTTLPKSLRLDLDQPADDTLTFQPSVVVSGQTSPEIYVLISTDTSDTVIQSKSNGSFSTVLNLEEGVNRIKTVVFDPTGDSRFIERTVYYSKEKL
ncbi:hypothetical protein HYU95_05125 [Candidatus Daviesbacteria bacterium]|nr:hypothetical protein [Candidatus Daviesbacteria bacterium]